MLRTLIAVAVIALVALLAVSATAQDPVAANWPQWGGPQRNFRIADADIPSTWGDGGPAQLWRRPLGEGYSSILADGDLLFTMYRDGDDEVVVALDAATGGTRWRHAYDAPLLDNGYFDVWLNSAGPGPYSSPLLAGGNVFTIGVNGHLHALDAQSGALQWSRNLVDEFELDNYNAFASSPIAYGDNIIQPLGGSGRGVVAFDGETGAVAWRSADFDLAPGSPLLIDLDGRTQLIVLGQQEVVGLDPADGRRLWSHPHANELGLNISLPLWGPDSTLFVSSAYDGGSRMIRLRHGGGQTTATEAWYNGRMRVHFGNALRMGDLILGSTGDFGPAFIAALDAATGEEVWRERTFARAHLLDAGGLLVIVDEDGEVALASATRDGLQVHAREQLLTSNAWTPPTLVGRVLYVRDRQDVVALDLGG